MASLGRSPGAAPLTSADIPSNLTHLGSHVKIPTVTTANLPGAGDNASITPVDGMLVYNSTLGMLQQRASGIWSGITTAPVITSFTYSDGASATAEKTVVGLVSVSCTTQTSTTVLVPGASLGIQVGMVVAGTGIPVGATVVSVILDTSFVISAAATASATVTLTFGGVVTITGTNFDSVLAGGTTNIGVTFDGTTATSISVNSLKTIITCTPPAHAAGTITMLVTNASGLTASTNFVYDEEAIFTTAAGSLGGFVEGTTFTANASAPRIQATDGEGSPSALTTGFQRVTSAADDTVITTTIGGLTVLTSGYLTGTLVAAANATTYPFYATAKDSQNQRTAPRLFNIISYDVAASGGTETSYSGYKVHTFTSDGDFTVSVSLTVDVLMIAGGGSGGGLAGGGGGGAGGVLYKLAAFTLAAGTYGVVVGTGGVASTTTGAGRKGGNTTFNSAVAVGGGGGALRSAASGDAGGGTGGSGGGQGYYSGGPNGAVTADSGTPNGMTFAGNAGGTSAITNIGGGGGGADTAGTAAASSTGGAGGNGIQNIYQTGVNQSYAGGGGGGNDHGNGASGGSHGGGTAAQFDSAVATAGSTPGSGGGAGSGGGSTYSVSGVGANGIVIIRYAA